MQIGILDGSLNLPWEKLFAEAARLGFDGVELGVGQDYDKTKLWNAVGRRELISLSQTSGVAIASICLHSYWHFSFASADAIVQKAAAKIATDAASIASELGAKNILIPITHAKDVPDDKAKDRWIDRVRQVAPTAEKAGVTFCLENVGQSFAKTAEQVAAIVNAIHSPAVKVYYDPGNAVSGGFDPIHEITYLDQLIGQVHIKDNADLLGQGQVPIRDVIASLKKIKYNGWLVFETRATADPPKAQAANLAYLKSLL